MKVEMLRELFSYHPNGWLIRKKRTALCTYIGQIVKGTCREKNRKYLTLRINHKCYYMHRIIFAIVKGEFPKTVDHINGEQNDNRIENLRAASTAQNNYNSKIRCDNQSGYRGICWRAHAKAWAVRLMINGKENHIGYFKNKNDAIDAQRKALIKYHGHFARI